MAAARGQASGEAPGGAQGVPGMPGTAGGVRPQPATDTLGDPISNPRSGSQAHQRMIIQEKWCRARRLNLA